MKNNKEVFQSFAMVMQFGINMLVPILACTLFGAWLGEKTGVIWLAIPFFIIGALAGMRNVFLFARRIYQPKQHPDKQETHNHHNHIEEKESERNHNYIEEKESEKADVKKTQ